MSNEIISDDIIAPSTQAVLQVKNLHVVYHNAKLAQEVKVVKDVSFSVNAGKILGIVGESGAGKSTVGYAIMSALLRGGQAEGKILVDGQDISLYSEEEKRNIRGSKIAAIVQNPFSALDPIMNIKNHFLESLDKDISTKNMNMDEKEQRIFSVLSDVELPADEEFLLRYPYEISGGQSQRVIIALALLLSPAILIADEPTTALDVFVQEQILVLIKKIIDKHKMVMLLITHNMGVVYKVADDIVVMKDAQIVETQTPDKLFKNPQELYTKNLIQSLPPKDITVERIPSIRNWDTDEDLALIEKLGLANMETSQEQSDAIKKENDVLRLEKVSFSVPVRKESFFKDYITHQKYNITNIIKHKSLNKYERYHAYDSKKILTDISLRIKKGYSLGLVGESGSGKSTIAKLIVGLINRTSGVFYKGKELSPSQVEADIQMIFQSPYNSLNPQKTLRSIFFEAISITRANISKEQKEDICIDLVKLIGLEADSLQKKPGTFSGGQLQRLCIARALILKPQLLLCDEPTSALDISVQADILNLLKYLQKNCELTMLFISHDLPVVRYMCDEIAVIKDGRIVEVQDTESIFRNPKEAYTQNLIDMIPSIPQVSELS